MPIDFQITTGHVIKRLFLLTNGLKVIEAIKSKTEMNTHFSRLGIKYVLGAFQLNKQN